MKHHHIKSAITATIFSISTLTTNVAYAGGPFDTFRPGPGIPGPGIDRDSLGLPPAPPLPPCVVAGTCGGGGGGDGGGGGGNHHNGPNWGGLAAGIAGAVIGGAIVNAVTQPRQTVVVQEPQYVPVSNNNAHIQYCFGKYKSYNVSTNTYRSYSGLNKPCISPYM